MSAVLNSNFHVRTSDEVVNGAPIDTTAAKSHYRHETKRIERASDRLESALKNAFALRAFARGCSLYWAQTHLMNGVEP